MVRFWYPTWLVETCAGSGRTSSDLDDNAPAVLTAGSQLIPRRSAKSSAHFVKTYAAKRSASGWVTTLA